MRTGVIFARGSCRTLKWMALFGVVFALGAGSAAAQLTAKVAKEVAEGSSVLIEVEAKIAYPAGEIAGGAIVVTATVDTTATTNTHETADISMNPNTVRLPFSARTAAATNRTDTLKGSIRVNTVHDPDAEDENVSFTLEAGGTSTLTGQEANPAALTTAPTLANALKINDDEDQTYVLALSPASQKPTENGDEVTISVKAVPEHRDGMVELRFHLDDPLYEYDTNTETGIQADPVTLGDDDASDNTTDGTLTGEAAAAASMATIAVTMPENDKNRVEDTVTLRIYSGAAKEEDALAIKVADANALPAVTGSIILLDEDGDPLDDQPEDGVEYIEEGQMVHLKVTVVDKDGDPMKADEKLSVMLMPTGDANHQDYRLGMHPVEIAKDAESASVEMTVSEDQDVGMEMLMFDADVSGAASNGTETRTSTGIVSVGLMDTTMRAVEAVSDEIVQEIVYAAKEMGAGEDMKFSPGEMIEIDASMLFTVAEGYSLGHGAMSDNAMAASASASGNMVMVTAKEPGMGVHITITATATAMMSGAKGLPQTTPNVAQVIFPVDVELADLMVTLSGPEDTNIAEGGEGAMITAMANRPVVGDTTVELIQTEGTASPADYMAEPLMIMDGKMEGATMLMAVEDDMMEDMEMVTLEGRVAEGDMGESMKTNTVMFYLWDAAVPALPIIAQLLLAAFLAIGGYRRYLRR